MPLKYLSKFFLNLEIPLINCEVSLDPIWITKCVLTSKATREPIPAGDNFAAEPAVDEIDNPTNAEFTITDCKLYVPVLTLSTENENMSN